MPKGALSTRIGEKETEYQAASRTLLTDIEVLAPIRPVAQKNEACGAMPFIRNAGGVCANNLSVVRRRDGRNRHTPCDVVRGPSFPDHVLMR